MFFCFTTVLWIILHESKGLPDLIRIGGLFDPKDEEQELAFYTAVETINFDNRIFKNSRIVAQVERLEGDDSFAATNKFCRLLSSGIAAVFGPQSDLTSMHVQSMCDDLEVPHVLTRWEYRLQRDDISVNLYPQYSVLNSAFFQLVEHWHWKKFFLLYEENEGIIRLQDFLKKAEELEWDVSVFQFPNSSSYRSVFWDIKRSVDTRKLQDSDVSYKIVLDVSRENLYEVLTAAQQVGMMTDKQRYLTTCLDLHTIDLEAFQYAKTSVTGLRLVHEEEPEYKEVLDKINYHLQHRLYKHPLESLRTETALMYEAVKLFAYALGEMDEGKYVEAFPPIHCDEINTMNRGSDGTSLINYMKNAHLIGITGPLMFDVEGFRSSVTLDIMYLTEEGLQKIGYIAPQKKEINITRDLSADFAYFDLERKHYIVTTIETDPYLMLKQSSKEMKGNDMYEGYTVDLLNQLAQVLQFTYVIRLVADGNYGSNSTGTWNGMMAEVMEGVAHMAVADLTITPSRDSAVDFTMPFMNTGISILFKKPTTKSSSLFSFLSPFSTEVWLYSIGAYTLVSVVLFIVGRLSPYEWSNPHPCRKTDLVEENNFSMLNTMAFTIGSLMQQGAELAAGAPSTRTIASMWYFFNLIMISSYTANLAAFLTIENIIYPIRNADDLAKQEKIKYGCVRSGSTKAFFEGSTLDPYKTMWEYMKRNDEVLVKNSEEGKARVKAGNYAFLMEATSIAFITERECDLMQVGGNLDSKGYGIAVKKGNSKLRAWLSGGILKLQEDGDLHTFKERWWKQKKGGGQCAQVTSSAVKELDLGNVGGVFVVMLLGLLLSCFVAVLEFLWFSRKVVKSENESLWSLLWKEMKFAATCGSSEKPAPKLRKAKKSDEKNALSHSPPSYNALY